MSDEKLIEYLLISFDEILNIRIFSRAPLLLFSSATRNADNKIVIGICFS